MATEQELEMRNEQVEAKKQRGVCNRKRSKSLDNTSTNRCNMLQDSTEEKEDDVK